MRWVEPLGASCRRRLVRPLFGCGTPGVLSPPGCAEGKRAGAFFAGADCAAAVLAAVRSGAVGKYSHRRRPGAGLYRAGAAAIRPPAGPAKACRLAEIHSAQ